MNTALFHELIPQIRRLLHREHEPIVTRKLSKALKNAGNGVFTTTTVLKGEALCLYPGVYCPGLPISMVDPVPDNPYGEDIEFLGHHSTPSGLSPQDNAYIMNVHTETGGYIDGMALEIIKGRHVPVREYSYSHKLYHPQLKTRLDSNPSCCGHMINHSIRHQNVQVLSFLWSDVLLPIYDNRGYNHKLQPAYTKKALAAIPNMMRQDGAPRYLFNGDLIYYATVEDDISRIDRVCGVVIYAAKHIGPDQELFLDYKLKSPLPKWAASWYANAE